MTVEETTEEEIGVDVTAEDQGAEIPEEGLVVMIEIDEARETVTGEAVIEEGADLEVDNQKESLGTSAEIPKVFQEEEVQVKNNKNVSAVMSMVIFHVSAKTVHFAITVNKLVI
jgi:hypothetical protein